MYPSIFINLEKYCKDNNINVKGEYFYIHSCDCGTVKSIIERDATTLDSIHLEIACKFSSDDVVKYMLNEKVKPTQRCFNAVLSRENESFDICDLNKRKKDITEIPKLQLLLNYGYNITQEDFAEITKKYIHIHDYRKYGLEIDDEIMEILNNSLFYPYDEIKTPETIALLDFSKSLSIKNLDIVIKRYNTVPNGKFVQFAFMWHKSKFYKSGPKKNIESIVRHIVKKYDVKSDEYSIHWAIKNGWTEKSVKRIFGKNFTT